ncbi:MAG: ligase-associated DNA damage response endonuclease PdeM [Methylobacteriaceae bacterium]|nr:ligase-associated DNA damage response endonuclease PdeM [Methylobacteriaceae bacterium]
MISSPADAAAGDVVIAGVALKIDPLGALIHEAERMLIVADLHLEKGSSYAKRGVMLPPYDTGTTLARLAVLIARWSPRRVVALGDSFHDNSGPERMAAIDHASLSALQAGRDWIWVAGNHDPNIPADAGGERLPALAIGPLHLRHEPRPGAQSGEIAGHLHPIARIAGRRRRCLITDGSRAVMPAFGAYAGGLNIHDAVFEPLFSRGRKRAHVLAEMQVFEVCATRCHPEELIRPIAWGMSSK